MMKLVALLCFLLTAAASDDEALEMLVEHSFDQGETFKTRGTIRFSNPRSSHGSLENELDDEDSENLHSLALAGGLYLVRVTSTTAAGDKVTAQGFAPACQMMQSSFRDTLKLFVHEQGFAQSVAELPAKKSCSKSTKPKALSPKTTVVAVRASAGKAPEVEELIAQATQQQNKQGEPEQQQQSFFAKYWMYIVPALLIFNLMSASAQRTNA